jgi:hypothetical protein
MTKHTACACPGAIGLEDAMVVHVAHEIFVLRAYGACGHGLIKMGCSTALMAI